MKPRQNLQQNPSDQKEGRSKGASRTCSINRKKLNTATGQNDVELFWTRFSRKMKAKGEN